MRLDDEVTRGALGDLGAGWRSEDGLKDAAVLAVVVERDGQDWMLFNRRRDDLPWHAGQVCFPGGAREGGEAPEECALRETCEEVGLEPGDLSLLGRLPDRFSIAGFIVIPFVARLAGPREYAPEESEVAEVFEVPVARFLDVDRWTERPTTHPRARVSAIPYFDYQERTVWGLTGIILQDFVRSVLAAHERHSP